MSHIARVHQLIEVDQISRKRHSGHDADVGFQGAAAIAGPVDVAKCHKETFDRIEIRPTSESPKLLQQCLRVLQICTIEPLGEPAVERGQAAGIVKLGMRIGLGR